MYEKINTVMFGQFEVTIYRNLSGEYFAEYVAGYHTKKVACGTDYFNIYNVLCEEIGDEECVDGEALMDVADRIEREAGNETTREQLAELIQKTLMEDASLWPASARDDIMYILEFRYGGVSHNKDIMAKVNPTAPFSAWLYNAITSHRIFRLTTPDEFDEQRVVITGAHLMPNNDYLMSFAVLNMVQDEDGVPCIAVNESFFKPFSECTLSHYKADELPAEYQEEEWD